MLEGTRSVIRNPWSVGRWEQHTPALCATPLKRGFLPRPTDGYGSRMVGRWEGEGGRATKVSARRRSWKGKGARGATEANPGHGVRREKFLPRALSASGQVLSIEY